MIDKNPVNEEAWKPVVGFEETYEISDAGRLRRTGAATGATVGRIVRPCDGGGWSTTRYVLYHLHKNNRCKTVRAHVLVFNAFVGPIPSGMEINHKDSNKANNTPGNLEAVTHRGNMKHASAVGALLRGESIKQAKLSETDVRKIRQMYIPGKFGCVRIAKSFNVGNATIWKIVKWKSWAHVA